MENGLINEENSYDQYVSEPRKPVDEDELITVESIQEQFKASFAKNRKSVITFDEQIASETNNDIYLGTYDSTK